MLTMKHASAILALSLAACGGDEGNTVVPPNPTPSNSAISQYLLKEFTSKEINLNTLLSNELLYQEFFLTETKLNGTSETSINRYSSISNKDNLLDENQFDLINSSWKNTPVRNGEAQYLIEDNWEKRGKAKIIAKGNDVILDYGNNAQVLVSASSRDISNLPVMEVNLNKLNMQIGPNYTALKTPPPAFPAGSQAYYLGYSPLKKTYFSSFGNPTTFTSIDQWTNYYSTAGANIAAKYSVCPFQFDLARKAIVFSNNPDLSVKCDIKEQKYERIDVKQHQLLVITETDKVKSFNQAFYAIANGKLLEGHVQEPFEFIPSGELFGSFILEVKFNKIALNHILKYSGQPLVQ